MPKIASIECFSLVWESEKSMAICLVYCLPKAPADALQGLLEAILSWPSENSKLLVLEDFRVHVDDVVSS